MALTDIQNKINTVRILLLSDPTDSDYIDNISNAKSILNSIDLIEEEIKVIPIFQDGDMLEVKYFEFSNRYYPIVNNRFIHKSIYNGVIYIGEQISSSVSGGENFETEEEAMNLLQLYKEQKFMKEQDPSICY